jgi:hypothetical protein
MYILLTEPSFKSFSASTFVLKRAAFALSRLLCGPPSYRHSSVSRHCSFLACLVVFLWVWQLSVLPLCACNRNCFFIVNEFTRALRLAVFGSLGEWQKRTGDKQALIAVECFGFKVWDCHPHPLLLTQDPQCPASISKSFCSRSDSFSRSSGQTAAYLFQLLPPLPRGAQRFWAVFSESEENFERSSHGNSSKIVSIILFLYCIKIQGILAYVWYRISVKFYFVCCAIYDFKRKNS